MLAKPVENGIILIDKPANMTSFGVVARVRRILTNHYGRKVKVGHSGTLDPFATGLMILVVGSECKNAASYSKLDKTYKAEIILGQTSSTGDPEGEISRVSDKKPKLEDVKLALAKFEGKITQKPPIYSAIKIGGERAYKLARRGQSIDMPLRSVTIYSIEMLDYNYPKLTIRTKVSSGTYIRSLAEDIGSELGVGAYCAGLRRETVGQWSVEDAEQISD